jgi:hypothetical protein
VHSNRPSSCDSGHLARVSHPLIGLVVQNAPVKDSPSASFTGEVRRRLRTAYLQPLPWIMLEMTAWRWSARRTLFYLLLHVRDPQDIDIYVSWASKAFSNVGGVCNLVCAYLYIVEFTHTFLTEVRFMHLHVFRVRR